MKQVVLYARVSTQIQADQGTSLTSQMEALRKLAGNLKLTVIGEIEEDASGATLDRPGLRQVRDHVEHGRVDAVACYTPDRLSRELVDMLILKREFERKGVQLLFVSIPDDNSPLGTAMLQMAGIFAELERKQILERTRRGKERRAREGNMLGSWMVPYGYRYVRAPGTGPTDKGRSIGARYEIIEEEARIVRLIFQWTVEEGCTLYRIALRLNEMGVPTKRGKRWWDSTVYHILKSETYMGIAYWNKSQKAVGTRVRKGPAGIIPPSGKMTSKKPREREEWIAIPVPAIVDRSTWEAAQRQREQNARLAWRNTRRTYLLRGLIKCGRCHYWYTAITKKFGEQEYPYYRCRNRVYSRSLQSGVTCDSSTYKADWLGQKVWAAVEKYITNPRRVRQHPPGGRREDASIKRDREALATIAQTLAGIEREETRLIDAYRAGVLDLPRFEQEMGKVRQRKEAGQDRQARITEAMSSRAQAHLSIETLEERRRLLRDGIETLDMAGKRRVLEALQITVHADGKEMTLTGLLTHKIVLVLDELDLSRYERRRLWSEQKRGAKGEE